MKNRKNMGKRTVILRSAQEIWDERCRKQASTSGAERRINENYELGMPIAEGEYASPTQCVLMCGFLVFQAKKVDDEVREFARRVLDVVFAAAAQNGFRNRDLLETMMAKGVRSSRVGKLAGQATAAIGDNLAFARVVARAGVIAGGKK